MENVMSAMLPLVTIFGAAVLIVGIVFFFDHRNRLLKNQERLAAIEKGMLPKDAEQTERCCDSRHSRFRGVKALFIGAGLGLALYVSAGPKAAVWGIFVMFIGLGHLVADWLSNRSSRSSGPGVD